MFSVNKNGWPVASVGILHPGEAGIRIAKDIKSTGHRVMWASEERSAETRGRAEDAELEDIGTIGDMAEVADVIISLCAASGVVGDDVAYPVAEQVASTGFKGVFADFNDLSNDTGWEVGLKEFVKSSEMAYVEGSIFGYPANYPDGSLESFTKHDPRNWHLLMSGEQVEEVAALFSGVGCIPAIVSGIGPKERRRELYKAMNEWRNNGIH